VPYFEKEDVTNCRVDTHVRTLLVQLVVLEISAVIAVGGTGPVKVIAVFTSLPSHYKVRTKQYLLVSSENLESCADLDPGLPLELLPSAATDTHLPRNRHVNTSPMQTHRDRGSFLVMSETGDIALPCQTVSSAAAQHFLTQRPRV